MPRNPIGRKQDRDVFIYGLCDPIDEKLRYVGKSVSPESRLSGHISLRGDSNSNERKDEWITSLLKQELEPDLFIIEQVAYADYVESEKFWIAYFRFIGCDLFNIKGLDAPKTKAKPLYIPRKERLARKEQRDAERKDLERRRDQEQSEKIAAKILRLTWSQQHAVMTLVDEFLREP